MLVTWLDSSDYFCLTNKYHSQVFGRFHAFLRKVPTTNLLLYKFLLLSCIEHCELLCQRARVRAQQECGVHITSLQSWPLPKIIQLRTVRTPIPLPLAVSWKQHANM